METRTTLFRLLGIAVTLLFAAALSLSACGGDEEPKDDISTPTAETARDRPQPTVAPAVVGATPTAAPSRDRPQPTAAPARVSASPTAAPVTGRMSLDEYVAFCSKYSSKGAEMEDEDVTYREMLDVVETLIDLLDPIQPPREVADFHAAALAFHRAMQKAIDEYSAPPDSDVSDEFLLDVFFPVALEHQEKIDEAVRALDPEIRDRMIAADCIEGDVAEALDVTELTLSKTEDVVLDGSEQAKLFSFQAQQGERYLIEVDKGTVPDFGFTSPFTETQFPQRIISSSGKDTMSATWVAPNSDTYFVQVWADPEDGAGSFTITVRIDPRPDRPSNVQYAWEGREIHVTWDAVDGADYYKIYYDDFFPEGCGVDEDGKAWFCGELASRVDGTSFVHTDPDAEENYYWVLACNSEGCSDFRNEAAPPYEARPPAPINVRHTVEGSGIRLNWDEVDQADFYIVLNYYDTDCRVDPGGGRGSCQEVATNLVATTYLHASPPAIWTNLYYWVAACNKGGCSEIDRRNPPVAFEDRSPVPARTPAATPAPRVAATAAPTPRPTQVPAPTPAATPGPTPTSAPAPTAAPAATAAPTPTSVPGPTATAATGDTQRPATPTNVRYALVGTTIELSWDAVAGADSYRVFHHSTFDSSCSVGRDGTPRFCDELAADVGETSYVHAQPSGRGNYYWVVACNESGCSDVDSKNPATPIEVRPESPANVRYAREDSTIRVTWDAVAGANYYKVYHDDFFDSSCRLGRDGRPGFCDELAGNVVETSYVHTEPDADENYYWVVACNRGGCSDIDSGNPARESE